MLPSPLCGPAAGLHVFRKKGVGSETKKRSGCTCGTFPSVSLAKQTKHVGDITACFWQVERFGLLKIMRKVQSWFLDGGTSLVCVAWRVGCRLVCLVYITLCLVFVGHLFMTRERAIPSCPGPQLPRPRPGCRGSRSWAGRWCSLSLCRGECI